MKRPTARLRAAALGTALALLAAGCSSPAPGPDPGPDPGDGSAGVREVRRLPADAGFDYQIGGDYALAGGVRVVSRDWFAGSPLAGQVPFGQDEAVAFATLLARHAHQRGLAVVRKNTPQLGADLSRAVGFEGVRGRGRRDRRGVPRRRGDPARQPDVPVRHLLTAVFESVVGWGGCTTTSAAVGTGGALPRRLWFRMTQPEPARRTPRPARPPPIRTPLRHPVAGS